MSDQASQKVLVVIGDVLHEPWRSISLEGQMQTWLTDVSDRVQIRHSHAKKLGVVGRWFDRTHEWARWHPRLHGVVPTIDSALGRPFRSWTAPVQDISWAGQPGWAQGMPDLYALQRWKVATSMKQCLRVPDWNFVYFTTASSYVRVGALLERTADLPRTGAFAGTLMVEGTTGEEFASGANRIFSRDVVQHIVERRSEYANDVMEDVGVSRLVAQMGVKLTPWPSMNVRSIDDIEDLPDSQIAFHHHFRLRSEVNGQRQDVVLMHRLHERVNALNAS